MLKVNLSLNDINTVLYLYNNLSDQEFSTLVNFFITHKSLSHDDKLKLFKDEFPELCDKILILGGNYFGSTTV